MELFESFATIPPGWQLVFFILQIWTYFWKGVAIWRASKNDQRYWFVALFFLLPLNDLGIVSLVYLFRFAKKRLTIPEVKGWIASTRKKIAK